MKKELLWAACISAVLGAGVLMLAGGSGPEGLPWQPLNEKLETALAVQEGTIEAAAEPAATKSGAGAKQGKSGEAGGGSEPTKSQTSEAKAGASQTEKGAAAAADSGRSGAYATSEPRTGGADSDTRGEANANVEQSRQADSRSSDLSESAAVAPKAAETSPTNAEPVEDGKIHINSANAAQLMELPGIGEKKAQAILDYRDKNGPFREVADIVKVKGIGPKMLEKMLPDLAL